MQIKFESTINVYKSIAELEEKQQVLFKKAIDQLDHAYAPYSNFFVAAALRLANDKIITGTNQENASYPLCMCAERVALHTAGNLFPDQAIISLAIVAKNPIKKLEKPVAPCGACRQVIFEYQERHKNQMEILLKGDGPEIYSIIGAAQLLPFVFTSDYLFGK